MLCLVCCIAQASVRRTHNTGRKHKDNVRDYYEDWYKAHYDVLVASGIPSLAIALAAEPHFVSILTSSNAFVVISHLP
jgi:hypothetical protein